MFKATQNQDEHLGNKSSDSSKKEEQKQDTPATPPVPPAPPTKPEAPVPPVTPPAPLQLLTSEQTASFKTAFEKCSWISLERVIKPIKEQEKVTSALLNWPADSLYLRAAQKMASGLEADMPAKLAFEDAKEYCVAAKYLKTTEGQTLESTRDEKLEEIKQTRKPDWSNFLHLIETAKQKAIWRDLQVTVVMQTLPAPKEHELEILNTLLLEEMKSGKDLVQTSNYISEPKVQNRLVPEKTAEKLIELVSLYKNEETEKDPQLEVQVPEYHSYLPDQMLEAIKHGDSQKALKFVNKICGADGQCSNFEETLKYASNQNEAAKLLKRIQEFTPYSWNLLGNSHRQAIEEAVKDLALHWSTPQ